MMDKTYVDFGLPTPIYPAPISTRSRARTPKAPPRPPISTHSRTSTPKAPPRPPTSLRARGAEAQPRSPHTSTFTGDLHIGRTTKEKAMPKLSNEELTVCRQMGRNPSEFMKHKAELSAAGEESPGAGESTGAALNPANGKFELPKALVAPLLKEASAAGLSPEQLIEKIVRAYLESDASEVKRRRLGMGWGR
jgi:hypothetical protein